MSLTTPLGNIVERKIKVRDWNVHYAISGHGPKYLTCLSGGFGFGMIFKSVLEGFDPDKFTVIAWDTPGYAKSRPPNRVLNENLYEDDAVYSYEFMMALKIPSYSVLGFCGGGRAAMIMAAKYPDQVESLILINVRSLHDAVESKRIDPAEWPEKYRNIVIKYSGEDINRDWSAWVVAISRVNQKRQGVAVSDEVLQTIQCNTLILAGAKDDGVDHHSNYLKSKIKNTRIYVYPEGGHFMHIHFAEDINKRMQQFLME